MDFQLQCDDIKKTVLTMSIEAKQQSYVMLKEAVIILKQRYNELLEEKYNAWCTEIPKIMTELIMVDKAHDASCKALSAIVKIIYVNHLHSPVMEAY